MSNLKKISILFCGISLGLGGMTFAKEKCDIGVDTSITPEECQTMMPSSAAQGHCKTGGYPAPVCVWSEGGCWAKCGG